MVCLYMLFFRVYKTGPFLHFFVLGLPISCMISVADLESALSATPIWKSPCQTIPTQNCSCTPIKKVAIQFLL
jgi:hypothetical protein